MLSLSCFLFSFCAFGAGVLAHRGVAEVANRKRKRNEDLRNEIAMRTLITRGGKGDQRRPRI